MDESRKGPHDREPSASKQPAPHSAATETMDEIVLTLSPATHGVVKVERLGKAGQRKELSEQDCAELAGDEVDEGAAHEAESSIVTTLETTSPTVAKT